MPLESSDRHKEAKTKMENGGGRLEQAQQGVEEVKIIMMENLKSAREREGKLGDLENRADLLLEKSKVFSKTATQVKHKKQWENLKWKVILVVVCVLAVIVIIGISVPLSIGSTKSDNSEHPGDG
ncbi:vesicle-associated membrane protein 5 [Trichomycterus rosablanca]|uniref:vesicle-associated membrane protein 5 n=1 Tax=Trichomycterus rosablanca TaxID=2290929 RepID=UPI002F35185D